MKYIKNKKVLAKISHFDNFSSTKRELIGLMSLEKEEHHFAKYLLNRFFSENGLKSFYDRLLQNLSKIQQSFKLSNP